MFAIFDMFANCSGPGIWNGVAEALDGPRDSLRAEGAFADDWRGLRVGCSGAAAFFAMEPPRLSGPLGGREDRLTLRDERTATSESPCMRAPGAPAIGRLWSP